jgi:putative FmdB family regulatory protein
MPVFEYKCRNCGFEFEELVFGTREISCPECDSKQVEKKISAFASGSSVGGEAGDPHVITSPEGSDK